MKRNFLWQLMFAGVTPMFAVEPTSGAGTPAPGVTQQGEPRKRAPKTNLLDIARGRLPLLFVHSIRFKETGTNAEVAKKYATSVGKVFDIKKGRNFEYIREGFKPTKEDVEAATKWSDEAAKHGGDKGGLMDVVNSYKVATPEEAAKQSAEITASRSKSGTKQTATGTATSAPAAGQPSNPAQRKALVS